MAKAKKKAKVGYYKAPDGMGKTISLAGVGEVKVNDGHVKAPESPEACQALLDLGFELVTAAE